MSRHHPYQGYDESSSHSNDGHRKHGFGGRGRGAGFGGRGGRRGGVGGFGGHNSTHLDQASRPYERELSHVPRGSHKALKSRGARGKLRGGFAKFDAAERELSIDERIQRERPCRTLFVRNVKYETNSQEVRDKFEQMGEIKIFFDLISTRGMAFITYYDLRAATMAKERLQGTDVSGRPIDVHYSLPKDNELERRCDRDKNQATLFLAISGANRMIDDDELRAKFEAYGEIRSIKHFKDSPYQRFIEFWDSRSCEQAHDDLVGAQYLGGTLDLKFSWDTGMVPKARLGDWRSEQDNEAGEYPYGYDDEHEEGGDFAHEDYARLGDRQRYENGGNNYGQPNPHQPTSQSYGSNSNGQPSFGNEIDERRLDQAHKVQELLASLSKTTGTENAPSVGHGQTTPHLMNNYPTDGSLSRTMSQSTFGSSGTLPTQLPSNFVPNYPTYTTVPSNDLNNLPAQASSTPQNYNQLAQIMGQLSSLSSAHSQPNGGLTSTQSASYPQMNDDQRNQTGSLNTVNNSSIPQPTLNLPLSVLALLQQQNGANSTNTGMHMNLQTQQNSSYPLIQSSTTSSTPPIPTAPRAMHSAAALSTGSSVQTSSNLLNSLPRQHATSSSTTSLGPSIPSQSNGLSATSAIPLNSSSQYNSTPTGASNSNPQVAVQQLLAILQQQKQQQ